MNKYIKHKAFMITLVCVVILAMIGISTLTILKGKNKKYILNDGKTEMVVSKIEKPKKENQFYYRKGHEGAAPIKSIYYDVHIEITRDGKTYQCDKVVSEYIENTITEEEEFNLKSCYFKDELNWRNLGVTFLRNEKIKFVFENYPYNSSKNVLYIYKI